MFATSKSDKRAGEESSEDIKAEFSLTKYNNRLSIMSNTGRSAYLVRISFAAENNFMHPVTCLVDTRAQPNLTSKGFLPTDWLSRVPEDLQPLF